MTTVGGALSGYCATGSTCDAINPASVMMIAMTPAKIGRLMKNCENNVASRYFLPGAGGAFGAAWVAAGGASVTATPGGSFSRLSTTTLSPAFRPDRIVQSLPIQ